MEEMTKPSKLGIQRMSSADLRRQHLREAQEKALQTEQEKRELLKRSIANKLNNVGKTINKINIAKWIDDLERDQQVADDLERINKANEEEEAMKALQREAKEACMKAIREHLQSFLEEHPRGTYEEWIQELHPDNVEEDKGVIDPRFYVEESDHRRLWNESLSSSNGDLAVRNPAVARYQQSGNET